jgi:hypothetical protein
MAERSETTIARLKAERDEAIAVVEYAGHIHDVYSPNRAGVFIAAYIAEADWAIRDLKTWRAQHGG